MTFTDDRRASDEHFGVLDGWRAISIGLVLAGHLLPLGPKRFELNGAAASTGMALFFTLSGFLIATFLLRRPEVPAFLLRRFFRIVPLAWLYCVIILGWVGASVPVWSAHLLFYGNLPPFWLIGPTAHLWSLALEMQFYVVAALLVRLLGRSGLYALPPLALLVTAARIAAGELSSIVTWLRADEILSGCTLAIVWSRYPRAERFTIPLPAFGLLALVLVASGHPRFAALNYARPYLASLLVGCTLYARTTPLVALLRSAQLAYVANVSYALYVIHGGLVETWLGSGDVVEKYLKRPLYFLVLLALAHLSTFHFERLWIEFGKRLSAPHPKPQPAPEVAV